MSALCIAGCIMLGIAGLVVAVGIILFIRFIIRDMIIQGDSEERAMGIGFLTVIVTFIGGILVVAGDCKAQTTYVYDNNTRTTTTVMRTGPVVNVWHYDSMQMVYPERFGYVWQTRDVPYGGTHLMDSGLNCNRYYRLDTNIRQPISPYLQPSSPYDGLEVGQQLRQPSFYNWDLDSDGLDED